MFLWNSLLKIFPLIRCSHNQFALNTCSTQWSMRILEEKKCFLVAHMFTICFSRRLITKNHTFLFNSFSSPLANWDLAVLQSNSYCKHTRITWIELFQYWRCMRMPWKTRFKNSSTQLSSLTLLQCTEMSLVSVDTEEKSDKVFKKKSRTSRMFTYDIKISKTSESFHRNRMIFGKIFFYDNVNGYVFVQSF